MKVKSDIGSSNKENFDQVISKILYTRCLKFRSQMVGETCWPKYKTKIMISEVNKKGVNLALFNSFNAFLQFNIDGNTEKQ